MHALLLGLLTPVALLLGRSGRFRLLLGLVLATLLVLPPDHGAATHRAADLEGRLLVAAVGALGLVLNALAARDRRRSRR